MTGSAHTPTRWAPEPRPPEESSALDGFLAGSDSIAAALVTRDGLVLEANAALERMLGPAATFPDTVVSAHRPAVSALIAEAGRSWRTLHAAVVRRGGELIDCKVWTRSEDHGVLVLAEPLRTPGERLNALLLELNDDLLAARRDLAAKNRRLRELDELKNMFLASATHDLKTPLTSILGYAEMLGEETDSPGTRRMALTIENGAQRLLTMINDLLGAAEIMTGELRLHRTQSDLMTVIRRALETIEPAARAREIQLQLDGPEQAVTSIDEHRIMQILDNLLSNAVKYSHVGGTVEVSCELRDTQVVVAVRDAGIGISLEDQKHLFGRYFRASTALELGIAGTGLGLVNARAFAAAHGGNLGCTSAPGRGSTFTLVLDREPES